MTAYDVAKTATRRWTRPSVTWLKETARRRCLCTERFRVVTDYGIITCHVDKIVRSRGITWMVSQGHVKDVYQQSTQTSKKWKYCFYGSSRGYCS